MSRSDPSPAAHEISCLPWVMIPGMENLHHLIETTGQDIEFQYFT
jgi:hypothetical protein